jgi:hypothetical protein
MGAAGEELDSEFFLQRLDLTAEGGLGEVHAFRRGGDAPFFRCREKQLQLP